MIDRAIAEITARAPAAENDRGLSGRQNRTGRKGEAHLIGVADRKAADTDRRCGPVDDLDELILRRVSCAVSVRVSSRAVGRISHVLVDSNRSQYREGHRV